MTQSRFSSQLQKWLSGEQPKTLGDLTEVFAEKSFAIAVVVLMFFPALPLPTGGVTHIFEIITILLALEMMLGRQSVWLPKWAKHRELGKTTVDKALPFIIRRIRWFEKFSKPRLASTVNHGLFFRMSGLIIFIFALGALLAVPFSGLDTLPSLAAVVVALSLILEDIALFLFGLVLGIFGIGLELALGAATVEAFRHIL